MKCIVLVACILAAAWPWTYKYAEWDHLNLPCVVAHPDRRLMHGSRLLSSIGAPTMILIAYCGCRFLWDDMERELNQ